MTTKSQATLKFAAEEIKQILQKHDIAGLVFLYDEHQGEYLVKIDTSKSVMKLEGDTLTYKSLLKDFNYDAKAKAQADEYSVGMLTIFGDMITMVMSNLAPVYDQLLETLKPEFSEPIHTPHVSKQSH